MLCLASQYWDGNWPPSPPALPGATGGGVDDSGLSVELPVGGGVERLHAVEQHLYGYVMQLGFKIFPANLGVYGQDATQILGNSHKELIDEAMRASLLPLAFASNATVTTYYTQEPFAFNLDSFNSVNVFFNVTWASANHTALLPTVEAVAAQWAALGTPGNIETMIKALDISRHCEQLQVTCADAIFATKEFPMSYSAAYEHALVTAATPSPPPPSPPVAPGGDESGMDAGAMVGIVAGALVLVVIVAVVVFVGCRNMDEAKPKEDQVVATLPSEAAYAALWGHPAVNNWGWSVLAAEAWQGAAPRRETAAREREPLRFDLMRAVYS